MNKKLETATEIELLYLRKRELDEKMAAQNQAWAEETRSIYKRLDELERRKKFTVLDETG